MPLPGRAAPCRAIPSLALPDRAHHADIIMLMHVNDLTWRFQWYLDGPKWVMFRNRRPTLGVYEQGAFAPETWEIANPAHLP